MSCKKTIQEWRRAIYVLNSYAAEFLGMDKILLLLKYSYDNLVGEQVKSCLLYCALFPEDDKILKEKLIEYWICEGIIDGSEGIEEAEDMGYEIIGSLVRALLLMEEVNKINGEAYVRMHDVVCEMALWIASDLGKQKEAFIVHADVGLCKIPQVKNWNVVRRMSLMKNKIRHLAGSHECLELKTLLLQGQRGEFKNMSSEFFKSMPKLAVLDLSFNESLFELPDGISNLVSLQYLNLSHTGILEFSKGLQELKKLIHLDLEETSQLKSIAGISRLQNLKVLKLIRSCFAWEIDTVEELEALDNLEILTTKIVYRNPGTKQYLSSHRLMSCTQSLHISHCKGLRELTFLMFAPNLRILMVQGANEVEDIINKEEACEVENSGIFPFPKLDTLRLVDLPKLKNIYWSPLPFPCLKRITIDACPNLKKLPLDSKSGKHGLKVWNGRTKLQQTASYHYANRFRCRWKMNEED